MPTGPDGIDLQSLREIRERLVLVRQAKQSKAARGLPEALTPAELDRVLPPVECLRTRLRKAGLNYEQYSRQRHGDGAAPNPKMKGDPTR